MPFFVLHLVCLRSYGFGLITADYTGDVTVYCNVCDMTPRANSISLIQHMASVRLSPGDFRARTAQPRNKCSMELICCLFMSLKVNCNHLWLYFLCCDPNGN